ncbi:hypothetical protein SEA_FLUDD_112 [Mycobacterium phage Fludd]|uniref:Uncharacterized protein n=18 Tax=Bixzunavirus TaxID=680114 RepID=A0A0N9EQY5_9CAUD|nr:hypothetical protein DANDELION_117 [Mycobacterium phage Dandelion]ALF51198.1 hypothetical protein SEA_ERNIEJ_106 [Mycobacterium phage ErnieJ]QAX93870.1 hypothetical protein SEA_SHELOB_114 [Mycobacterium phage Shelob]QAY07748.1 hypothetical protein SEA_EMTOTHETHREE_114 [Mycobacterium phage EmToTheThree]QAY09702.1 hypothetical protein SEA_CHARGIE21_108 [Mycobacterium phage Chargie21]QAY14845.1 hypothetical protein SEA_FLUDD_112 [Mycobacterium phage Fludd]QAY15534.1 hypothetical protein SEA_B
MGGPRMNTYLVRLADRHTGEGQRILVQDRNPSTDPATALDDMQRWVDAHKESFDPPLQIADPMVIDIHLLKMKRPARTVLPTATRVPL